MHKTIHSYQTLQVKKSFTIVEDSIDVYRISSGAERTYRRLKRLIRRYGGWCDWSLRRLAAAFGIGWTTLRTHIRELRRVGLLLVRHRPPKRGDRLSETNVYTLGEGGVSEIGLQKLKARELNTTTPSPGRRVENNNPAMRKLFDRLGVAYAQLRSLRAIVRGGDRKQSSATVGGYSPVTTEETEAFGWDLRSKLSGVDAARWDVFMKNREA